MFLPFASFISLVIPSTVVLALTAVPAEGLAQVPTAAAGTGADDNVVVVTDNGPTAHARCIALTGATPVLCSFEPAYAQAVELPKVWIGIRITPVPAPLGAHIGAQGVMVGNVYKGSPADQAGLEQYDVIVALGAEEIKEPQALTKALMAAEPGQSITLTVVRKAARQDVTLALAARPEKDPGALELKYKEPDDEVDAAIKMYGKALELGPGGRWVMKDLGSLYKVPDVLKEFEIKLDDPDLDWSTFDWPTMGRDLDIKVLRKLHEGDGADAEAAADKKVEIRVRVTDDGRTTTVERDAEGKITVTRTSPDGNQTTASYENAEALKDADAEAYELYQSHAGRGRAMIHVRPLGHQAQKLRKDFQIEVEQRMKEALEKARQAQGAAAEEYRKAMEEAQQAVSKARVMVRTPGDDGATAKTESLLVFVGDDGIIKVTVSENGETSKYEFKSKEEFQASKPELYERVRELLE